MYGKSLSAFTNNNNNIAYPKAKTNTHRNTLRGAITEATAHQQRGYYTDYYYFIALDFTRKMYTLYE